MTATFRAVLRTLPIFALMMCATACAGGSPSAPGPDQVKVDVGRIGMDHRTGTHYVLLRDKSGRHALPIMIGANEARAILLAMHGVRTPRPLSDQLLATVIHTTGNHVDRVVISDLHNDVYYSDIYLDDGRYKIDSRPSDAIALAMNTDAPIYVVRRLLQKAGRPRLAPGKLPTTARALGLTVQDLTPELARDFKAAPGSGVLVSMASGAAANAGIKRGDIVTRVGDYPVTTLETFRRSVAGASGPVRLTVRRGGSDRVITLAPDAGQGG